MSRLRTLTIIVIAFGFGIIAGYALHGYPPFESIVTAIAGGISLGGVIQIISMFREWVKEKKEEKTKTCEKLEGYLQEHSEILVNEVLRKWFEAPTTFPAIVSKNCYNTPLTEACYEPHFKSAVGKPHEPYHLRYIDQAVQHLKEYTDTWDLWLLCKRSVGEHLEKVVKIWENIEKKLVASIPAKFVEWKRR
jgi:hypothetical protein